MRREVAGSRNVAPKTQNSGPYTITRSSCLLGHIHVPGGGGQGVVRASQSEKNVQMQSSKVQAGSCPGNCEGLMKEIRNQEGEPGTELTYQSLSSQELSAPVSIPQIRQSTDAKAVLIRVPAGDIFCRNQQTFLNLPRKAKEGDLPKQLGQRMKSQDTP